MISIYKITCETGKVYYGSTKHIKKRFKHHTNVYNTSNSKGFLNPKFEILETCNEEERKDKESYYIRNFECVNKRIENRTLKEYYQEFKNDKTKYKYDKIHYEKNKEIINNKKRIHYEKNKEIILEKKKVKITCKCGSIIRKDKIKRHERSKKHLEFEKTINPQ